MRKIFYPVFLALAPAVFIGTNTMAQKPAKTTGAPASSSKKPPVKSWLGKNTGNISLDAAAAGEVIALPLKVTDDKNVDYVISSYQFAYKRIGVTEDEETGKTSAEKDLVSDHFTATPLPVIWQNNISETLHTGETLYFFDIIVFDKQGRRFFAPELKITIQ